MIEFPDILKVDFSSWIDERFEWFRSTFWFIFGFMRTTILMALDFVQSILTYTPWWVWVASMGVFTVFILLKKKKWAWLTAIIPIFAWLVYYNIVLINPGYEASLHDGHITPWWVFIVLLFAAATYLSGWKTGLILSFLLFLIGVFNVWEPMVYTLTIIIISVFISFMVGLPLGIIMAKSKWVESILKPVLDTMQTIPSFVYLIPAVMLFQEGRVPATFATIIYSLPPLIRLTFLGIKNINKEVIEAGESFGSTPLQMLFKIEIPQALSTIATGLNQTTMMAVAMVVIASMIGAEGLGRIVLVANRQIDIGSGVVAGFAIVFLAIILDRLLQGVANKFEHQEVGNG